jgi:hypothetical protein
MPLYVADRWITKLSGPKSLRWLKPVESNPFIMMLGDNHFSSSGSCPDCMCYVSTEACCYQSYDPQFLQLLDHLSTPAKKIKIYIETFTRLALNKLVSAKEIERLINESKGAMKQESRQYQQLPELYTEYQSCFYQLGDKTAYNRHCPTRNIEWHFADARGRSYIDKRAKMPVQQDKGVEYKYDFEYHIFNLILSMKTCWQRGITFQPPPQYYPHYEVLMSVIDISTGKKSAVKNLVNTFLKRDDSLVAKETKNFQKTTKENLPELITKYYLYLASSEPKTRQNLDLDLLKFPRLVPSQKQIDDAFMKLVQMTSSFMDIYFVFRVLKRKDSWLDILCAGEEHCENIRYFLCEICGWYTLEEFAETNTRCLNLSSVNLNLNFLAGLPQTMDVSKTIYEDYRYPDSAVEYDAVRNAMLKKSTLQILYTEHQMPTDEQLQTKKDDLSADEVKWRLKLEHLVEEFTARERLKTAKTEQDILQQVSILCEATSTRTVLTQNEIFDFFKAGFYTVLEKIVNCNPRLTPYIIKLCVQNEKPQLALKYFQIFNIRYRPDPEIHKNLEFIDEVIGLLEEEAVKSENKIFNAYEGMLRTFRGLYDHPEKIKFLIENHKEFAQAWDRGHFKHTLVL